MVKDRLNKDNKHLTSVYGNITVGINGELPKFSDTVKGK